ncbi:MAG: lipoprotein [Gallionellaceae bacterium]
MRLIGIMLLFALSLQACGHRGPLFLPQDQAAPQAQSQEK